MSSVLIIGESGSGKTASLRNFDPKTTLLIQVTDKELPFKSKDWGPLTFETKGDKKVRTGGNIIVTRSPSSISKAIANAHTIGFSTVIVDDLQYMLSFELFDRVKESGYNKFTDIALSLKEVIDTARVTKTVNTYFLAHAEDVDGIIKMKTVGKMINEKLTPEGLFAVVLRSVVIDGEYYFLTRNSSDTTKTPIGMFDKDKVENDLAVVDKIIREYYS